MALSSAVANFSNWASNRAKVDDDLLVACAHRTLCRNIVTSLAAITEVAAKFICKMKISEVD